MQELERIPLLSESVDKVEVGRTRSLNATKSGRIYGTFVPHPPKSVKIQKSNGEIVNVPMSRKDRRILARRVWNGKAN